MYMNIIMIYIKEHLALIVLHISHITHVVVYVCVHGISLSTSVCIWMYMYVVVVYTALLSSAHEPVCTM